METVHVEFSRNITILCQVDPAFVQTNSFLVPTNEYHAAVLLRPTKGSRVCTNAL